MVGDPVKRKKPVPAAATASPVHAAHCRRTRSFPRLRSINDSEPATMIKYAIAVLAYGTAGRNHPGNAAVTAGRSLRCRAPYIALHSPSQTSARTPAAPRIAAMEQAANPVNRKTEQTQTSATWSRSIAAIWSFSGALPENSNLAGEAPPRLPLHLPVSGQGGTLLVSPECRPPRCFRISPYCGCWGGYSKTPSPTIPGCSARRRSTMVPSSFMVAAPMLAGSGSCLFKADSGRPCEQDMNTVQRAVAKKARADFTASGSAFSWSLPRRASLRSVRNSPVDRGSCIPGPPRPQPPGR